MALTITIEDGVVYIHGPKGCMSLEAAEACDIAEVASETGLTEAVASKRMRRAAEFILEGDIEVN